MCVSMTNKMTIYIIIVWKRLLTDCIFIAGRLESSPQGELVTSIIRTCCPRVPTSSKKQGMNIFSFKGFNAIFRDILHFFFCVIAIGLRGCQNWKNVTPQPRTLLAIPTPPFRWYLGNRPCTCLFWPPNLCMSWTKYPKTDFNGLLLHFEGDLFWKRKQFLLGFSSFKNWYNRSFLWFIIIGIFTN